MRDGGVQDAKTPKCRFQRNIIVFVARSTNPNLIDTLHHTLAESSVVAPETVLILATCM